MGKGIGEPDRQPAGDLDEAPAPVGSGEGQESIAGPGARPGLEADLIRRAALVRQEWTPTRPSTGIPRKKQALWFGVAVLAGCVFGLILLAIN